MKEKLKKLLVPLLALSFLCNMYQFALWQNCENELLQTVKIYEQKVEYAEANSDKYYNNANELRLELIEKNKRISTLEKSVLDAQRYINYLESYFGLSLTSFSDSSSDTSYQNTYNVWITATGNKYHSRSNCGNTKTAWQVSIDEAMAQGYTACKNCW